MLVGGFDQKCSSRRFRNFRKGLQYSPYSVRKGKQDLKDNETQKYIAERRGKFMISYADKNIRIDDSFMSYCCDCLSGNAMVR